MIQNRVAIAGLLAYFAGVGLLRAQQLCSTEKVNRSCFIVVDRTNPMQPPTIQIYPGQVLIVRIIDALPFEQVSLDWQSTSANLMPDTTAAVLTALNPALAKSELSIALNNAGKSALFDFTLKRNDVNVDQCASVNPGISSADAFYQCAAQIQAEAADAAKLLTPVANPDSLVLASGGAPLLTTASNFDNVRTDILCRVLNGAAKDLEGNAIDCSTQPLDTPNLPYHDLVNELAQFPSDPGKYTGALSLKAKSDLAALGSALNAVVSPLVTAAEDLTQLGVAQLATGNLGALVDPVRRANPAGLRPCNSVLSAAPVAPSYGRLLQRQVSCAVNLVNLASNSINSVPTSQQKKSLVVITANFTDSRIDTSAGILLSALPSRSFSVGTNYSGTPPAPSSMYVKETDIRPLVIPYAAFHVRLKSDWAWKDGRRGAAYATILAGVNPNTTTADFGAGLSLSWRTLIFGPVAHFAHDVGLNPGFTKGESLGTSFSGTLPTHQFWTTSVGLAIGVRVPLIPGR